MRFRTAVRGIFVFILLILSAACRLDVLDSNTSVTETPAIQMANPTISPSPTPKPVIVISEPEHALLSDALGIPAYYTCLVNDGTYVLYAFTDDKGNVVYRTVGVTETLTDGVLTERRFAWYEAEEDGSFASAVPIDPTDESPGICISISLDGIRLKQNCTAADIDGLFCLSANGSVSYYVYGSFEGCEPSVYPSLSDGSMIEGALAVDADLFFVSPYAPKETPTKDGERYLIVYIGSQSVAAFVAEDGDWRMEHVFICSTGMKNYTPRGSFTITQQYAYKAMSELNDEMVYAQYASRFYGHYLFHTIPSAGEYKNYQPNGKQQVLVAEYEKLGSALSHGCVRMQAGDCYWIYRNCPIGTRVLVTDDVGPEPPESAALIYVEPYMDASQTYGWDPTDPDPNNPYLLLAEYADSMIVPTLPPSDSITPRPTNATTPKPTPKA